MKSEDSLPTKWDYAQRVVNFINENPGFLEGLTRVCSMQQAYQIFWDSVKVTSIICTTTRCCLLYGSNSETHRLYGVLTTYPFGHAHEELVRRYGVPGKPIEVYILHHGGAYEVYTYSKSTSLM